MSSVNGVSATNTTYSTTTTNTGSMEELGEDTFMQLLLTQLQNQDPLDPMDNTEFIAQLAQFNSLNELTAINTNLSDFISAQEFSRGTAMIGKTVTASTGTQTFEGVVSGVQRSGEETYLIVDGMYIPVDAVNSVTQPSESTEASDG